MTIELNINDSITQILTDFADSFTFWEDFNSIFGTQFDRTIAEDFRNQWLNQDFSTLPSVEIISSNILGNANGGYSAEHNTIYLSDGFVTRASSGMLTSVLLEEIGHFIDTHINETDTVGDEGEHFAKVIQGIELTPQDVQILKSDNDFATIIIDGQPTQIETNTFSLLGEQVTVTVNFSGTGSDAGNNPIPFDIDLFTQTFTVGSGQEITNRAVNATIVSSGINQVLNGSVSVDVSANTIQVSFSGTQQPGSLEFIFSSLADQSIYLVQSVAQTSTSGLQSGVNLSLTPTVNNDIVSVGFVPLGTQPGVNISQTSSLTYGIPTTLTVTNTNDSGAGSLRAAINAANASPDTNLIDFNIASGVQTINLSSALPTITTNVIIDGTTQNGFSSSPIIEINGGNLSGNGLTLGDGSSGSRIKGLVINRFNGNGIVIQGDSENNVITGNFIGVGASGASDQGNGGTGIRIETANNIIGGGNANERNVISGNTQAGILVTGTSATDNTIQGNYIGINATGTGAIKNDTHGIQIANGSKNNLIGTNGDGTNDSTEGNVISGNGDIGVITENNGTTGNVIAGNYIGTNPTGTSAIANKQGIYIGNGAENTLVGTNSDGISDDLERNIISGNTERGILIINGSGTTKNHSIKGNYIGTSKDGSADLGNGTNGIEINGATNITIGGSTANDRNIISGNNQRGIYITGSTASGNSIEGNYIGTNKNGNGDLGNSFEGITIDTGSNTIKNNLISGNDGSQGGLYINGTTANNNTIVGNKIGTDATGNSKIGNSTRGITINNGSNNTIGGSNTIDRNIISGNNQVGVYISGSNGSKNIIENNYIGTDIDGDTALGNSFEGITFEDTISNTIKNNVISANGGSRGGIWLFGSSTKNTIVGNKIGTDATGNLDLGNSQEGITIDNGSNNTIGGSNVNDRNIISGNNQAGIYIINNGVGNLIEGNYIGTNIDGSKDLGNSEQGLHIQTNGNTVKNNVISGNDGFNGGLWLNSTSANNNTIVGNKIGTDATGNSKIGNSTRGITINNGSNNTIGGSNTIDRNIISGNNEVGIVITGSSGNSNLVENNYIGTNIDGNTALGNGFEGIAIENTNNNIKNNLISANGGSRGGIWLYNSNAKNNTIIGNKIGTDVTGNLDLGNSQEGITIDNASNNTIGGSNVNDRNIISGNDTAGILIINNSNNNSIEGNYIGTDIDGDTALGNNFEGIGIYTSPNNTIKNNVISANKSSVGGVVLEGSNTQNSWVTGNKIGTNASGNNNLGNTSRGISINGGSSNNIIGSNQDNTNDDNEGNLIANNSNGVFIDGSNNNIVKNQIINNSLNGIAIVNGSNSVNNLISQNKITNNGELGIDLNYDGITPNDVNDTDNGTNNLQNYPLITIDNSGLINGFFNSTPNSTFRIEYFSNTSIDPSGKGEGETFIGFEDVTTDGNGNGILSFDAKNAPNVTATATIANNTSEFSSVAIIPVVTIEAIDATASENGDSATFRISRTGDLIPLTVNYTITGTATNGVDYNTITSLIEIPLNQTYADITITPIDNFIDNEDKTVILTLTDSNDYDLGTNGTETDTVTIEDNDTVGVIITESAGNTSVTEGIDNDSYSIVLNSQPTDDVIINISPDSQIQTDVSTITFTTANWNIAQTINVFGVNDSFNEGNHTGVISHTAHSQDPKYNDISISSVNVSISEAPLYNTRGTSRADTLIGNNGRNIISGDGNNDFLSGQNFVDTLMGGSGNDTLKGFDNNDFLDGGSGNDLLKSGEDNDILIGGSGNDTLIGGMGNDNLSGGSGVDSFVFNSPSEGVDRITDFNVVDDFIVLNGTNFNLNSPWNGSQFVVGSNAGDGDDRIIYNQSIGELFYDSDGIGGNVQVQIAILTSRPNLTTQDFIISM